MNYLFGLGAALSYFATEYTIHFDDTMAYGSHHFLTAFRFQCAARESYLFGERIFDLPGVREVLDRIHLLTADAYSRNLSPAILGDRVAILLTLEEWGRASARFCYRVLGANGVPICAGFQSMICADAETGNPISVPSPLWEAMESMRDIEEPLSQESFRDRVLAGGSKTAALFGDVERRTVIHFLTDRHPSPRVISAATSAARPKRRVSRLPETVENKSHALEAWMFAGQGAFDPSLLSERIVAYTQLRPSEREVLDQCAAVTQQLIQGDAFALVSGSRAQCADAVHATPELLQIGIHLQNVLGGMLRQSDRQTPSVVIGHSFGEIAALSFAGCFDLQTGVRVVCERVRAISTHAPPDGALIIVSACRHHVQTEAALLSLEQIVVAGRNHEEQTVVSGPRVQLDRLQEYLRGNGTGTVSVPSQTCFHHPLLRGAAIAWRNELNSLAIGRPTIPIYSPNGRRFISSGDDVATILASQLLRPFDLQGAIADLVECGVTKLIDCGSRGSLAGIVSKATPISVSISGIETGDNVASAEGVLSHTPDVDSKSIDQSEPTGTKSGQEAQTLSIPSLPAVAIVAHGCVLPGGASSPQRLHTAILEQRMGIVDQRDFDPSWSQDFYSEELVPDRSTSHLTGRINEADIDAPAGIDALVFNEFTRAQRLLCVALAPCIALLKDAERVLCLVGATADGFEDQDVASSLRFAGINPTDQDIDDRMNTARSANQEPHDAVQEVFDRVIRPGLEVTLVDAACASSLYAVALGMLALESAKTDAVVAGGVFCPGPGNSCLFSQFHGTTSTGCRPFDAGADGVVFSEGAAVVVLRRIADAERLGLPITAIVRGAGLSSDGRSPSANVPQSDGQLLSLERCYVKYGIDPASVQGIESHGTSTPVGDSTELQTLKRFFAGHATQPIPLHSLKGLLGHAGWAAGTASIAAACQYLETGIFPQQAGHRVPSDALVRSRDTLVVPAYPVALPKGRRRIAIDGFGFGGANAHLVLESYTPKDDVRNAHVPSSDSDDIVFVAYHELVPTLSTPMGLQFDRDQASLPDGYMLLPDLADDMDISQVLAVKLAHDVISQIPQFDDGLRQQTSVVLAQSGKTERGVEATMRVLAPRFRRLLFGLDQLLSKVDVACDRARPSGPYTLQCMMPNVSSGRAALQCNLNGPNFVVDSGARSLESAMMSASLLLNGNTGTKLVIVAALDARKLRLPPNDCTTCASEYAAAFAVTTRSFAENIGIRIIGDVAAAMDVSCNNAGSACATRGTAQKVRAWLDELTRPKTSQVAKPPETRDNDAATTESKFPIHVPIWVEAPIASNDKGLDGFRETAVAALVPSDGDQAARALTSLSRCSQRHLVVVVGAFAQEVADALDDPNVIAAELLDEDTAQAALNQVDRFEPEVIIAVESVNCWEPTEVLGRVGTNNALCEFLFLLGKHNSKRLNSGSVGLWGLFQNGWNDAVHPVSGATAGLLKAVHREIPSAQVGVICTRDLSLDDALACVALERRQCGRELEVVYDGANRLVRRLRAAAPAPAKKRGKLNANSVVVASGGARGVTAVLLETLLRDYQCTVVALGRSILEAGPTNQSDAEVESCFYETFIHEHPAATLREMKKDFGTRRARWEAHRTIQDLSSLGNVEYIVTDVTDREQVKRAIQDVTSKYGQVDLILHGAGVQLSKRLGDRSLAEFRKTFSVKVTGLHNLVDECCEQLGRTVNTHLLTSAYSIFGNDGQHDYGAANETLDRLCALNAATDSCDWSSIAWLAWDGIGMTQGSEYHALARNRGLSGLTADDGRSVFREVLANRTAACVNVPMSATEHVSYAVKTIPPPIKGSSGQVIELSVPLSQIEHLRCHIVRDIPTLPGAWILDHLVNAGMRLQAAGVLIAFVSIEDVTFHRFVRHAIDCEPKMRVVAEETSSGIVAWMIGNVVLPDGITVSRDVVFAQAKLHFDAGTTKLDPLLQSGKHYLNQPDDRFVNDPYCDGRSTDVELSGPFDCLREISIGRNGRHAKFSPNPEIDVSGVIPTLLLDSALRVGAMYATADEQEELCVPVRIGRIIAPVGIYANSSSTSGWEIRTSVPTVENRYVSSRRTEVSDELGNIKLMIEDSLAMRLR